MNFEQEKKEIARALNREVNGDQREKRGASNKNSVGRGSQPKILKLLIRAGKRIKGTHRIGGEARCYQLMTRGLPPEYMYSWPVGIRYTQRNNGLSVWQVAEYRHVW